MKLDFMKVGTKFTKEGVDIFPVFLVKRSKDLMVRGKSFYAVWDEDKQMWSTDEYDVQRLVDDELYSEAEQMKSKGYVVNVRTLSDYSTGMWTKFKRYVSDISDSLHILDEKLTFANTVTKRSDYVSKRLPYSMVKGECDAYDQLMATLYDPDERKKLEWAIGAVITGDARDIQKFIVLYGEGGTGKSTVLNIIMKLFEGYYTTFDAKALTGNNNAFSTEVFRGNPLVAIQHDGDLSKIEDNTKLNSIVSHEEMALNEKYKATYMARLNCFLFMASNKPVKITDAKSGIIRRLIDVKPSGRKLPPERYFDLMDKIPYELGAIAVHCRDIYRELGRNAYSSYRPLEMMLKTDLFFNFVEDSSLIFEKENGVTLKTAYTMYKQYCDDSGAEFKLPMYKFREELKNYFENFEDMARIDGKQYRSWYSGFKHEKLQKENFSLLTPKKDWLVLTKRSSKLDILLADCYAQLADSEEKPVSKWSNVKTRLHDIQTDCVHYVKPPYNFVVVDFDIRDEKGMKNLKLNLDAAAIFPATYAEVSKGGQGVHLHYIYEGDVEELQTGEIAPGIEIKTFPGNASLRRRLTKCNGLDILKINSGLPLKQKKMLNTTVLQNEKHLRNLIEKNLNKEIHGDTSSSINFIFSLLEEARSKEIWYDLTDLRPDILAFAAKSTNQAERCVNLVSRMVFKYPETVTELPDVKESSDDYLIFFDIEVFPNLFVVCWKRQGIENSVVSMVNPSAEEIEELVQHKLVGFNCRKYDNHILYGRILGYSVEELYQLSKRIIADSENGFFKEAYNLSYTDIYDFSSKKQSLKKWEIELGIHHQELGFRWDQPVDESMWETVVGYCCNDVVATEAVFYECESDFNARKILVELCNAVGQKACVNDKTNSLTAKLILRGDSSANQQFVYPNLSEKFPGYNFSKFGIERTRYSDPTQIVNGKSIYRGIDPGEGGYVYAKPGIYYNVVTFDVASMHPSSIIAENGFGKYTENLKELLDIRLKIKHKEFDSLKQAYGGALTPYLGDEKSAKQLSFALKIAINSVYGLTAAHFTNSFRDIRNEDNWVAKRGALFMIDLRLAVEQMGGEVVHVKTDSIKVVNPSQKISDYIYSKGKEFGYTFEIEAIYERFCLINDAVYIAKTADGEWSPTGKPFLIPYVMKKLFTKEPIEFKDLTETFNVTTALYLDFNEDLPNVDPVEKEIKKLKTKLRKSKDPAEIEKLKEEIEEKKKEAAKGHNYIFVGKAGQFCPVKEGTGGGRLVREKDGEYLAAGGTTGYLWKETEVIRELGKEEEIDRRYFDDLAETAKAAINEWGDYEVFVSDDIPELKHGSKVTEKSPIELVAELPYSVPCGDYKYAICEECPEFCVTNPENLSQDLSQKTSQKWCKKGFLMSCVCNP